MIKRTAAALVIGALVAGSVAVHGVTATARPASAHPAMGTMSQTIMLGSENMSGVTGVATLTYNPMTKSTTAKLVYKHLHAMSAHPAHFHLGSSCSANGAVAYAFAPLHAGNNGIATETMTFPAKLFGSGVKAHYYINLHQGPSMMGKGGTVVACGVVNNM